MGGMTMKNQEIEKISTTASLLKRFQGYLPVVQRHQDGFDIANWSVRFSNIPTNFLRIGKVITPWLLSSCLPQVASAETDICKQDFGGDPNPPMKTSYFSYLDTIYKLVTTPTIYPTLPAELSEGACNASDVTHISLKWVSEGNWNVVTHYPRYPSDPYDCYSAAIWSDFYGTASETLINCVKTIADTQYAIWRHKVDEEQQKYNEDWDTGLTYFAISVGVIATASCAAFYYKKRNSQTHSDDNESNALINDK